MKRNILKTVATSLVLAFIFSIGSFALIAGAETVPASGECGKDVNYTFDETTGELRIFGTGDMYNFDSLSMFESFRIAPWYSNGDAVKTVVIEEGVTSIGDCAFDCCENMTGIEIPQSVKRIGWGAFANCESLVKPVIPEGVETIDRHAFLDCKGIKTISIPKTVTEIGSHCFENTSSLKAIVVNAENPNYSNDRNGVLYDKNQTELIHFPEGSKRPSYTMPDSVVEVADYAFYSNPYIESIVFSKNLKKIGFESFSCCTALTELNLPEGLEKIGWYAFAFCSGIDSVTVPEGTKEIDSGAFSYCEALSSVTLPDSLERIGMFAFLKTPFFNNEANRENGVLYCGKNLLDVNSDYTGELVIKHGTRLIADDAASCKNITSVSMPNTLEIIGHGAFSSTDLTSVYIPSSVTTLIGATFSSCNGLVNVTIPETVKTVGGSVFYNCENLESVEIKAKISEIAERAFADCPKLTNVTLPDTVTKIGECAFEWSNSLETLVLPDGVEIIDEQAFYDARKLTNINLPESLTSIGYQAFSGTNINNITIPANVTFIDESAFSDTKNLTDFSVDEKNASFMYDGNALYSKDKLRLLCYFVSNENKVYAIDKNTTQIDRDAFDGNTHLERITFPENATDVGSSFDGCSNLKSFAISGRINVFESYWFRDCTSLEKIYIAQSPVQTRYSPYSGNDNIKDIYFGGTQEEWEQNKVLSGLPAFENATIHYDHVHSHSLDAESNETYAKYGYRLYSCECGHYYAEYDIVSKAENYDVSAIYAPGCFDEEVVLDAQAVTGDREPGGVYMVDGKTYKQIGVYNIKPVNGNGETVQPNEGYTVQIKMAVPDGYKDKTDMVIYHRFVDGGREKLSTADGTLVIEDGYMIFEVSKFSEFTVLAETAEFELKSESDEHDVTAGCTSGCFDEEITLEVETQTGSGNGTTCVIDKKIYKQIGVYDIKAVNKNGEAVQPNKGHTVKMKMAVPESYAGKTESVILHRFDGGEEMLSTADGTLVIQGGYMNFEVSRFGKFVILEGMAEYEVKSDSDEYDVSVNFSSCCFNEDIALEAEAVTGTEEHGVIIVDGKAYEKIGNFSLRTVNEKGETVQPNKGHSLIIRTAVPDAYADGADVVINHR
ncbi:MAG: leucine-rich repeat domain-containing protein, partial [Clostridia bacterium]|nr:leucine-rich repeat domain-containing protein [Clostridia bacterium]